MGNICPLINKTLSLENRERAFSITPDRDHHRELLHSRIMNYRELAVVVPEEDNCFNKEVQPSNSD
jgi:hypothetical protein